MLCGPQKSTSSAPGYNVSQTRSVTSAAQASFTAASGRFTPPHDAFSSLPMEEHAGTPGKGHAVALATMRTPEATPASRRIREGPHLPVQMSPLSPNITKAPHPVSVVHDFIATSCEPCNDKLADANAAAEAARLREGKPITEPLTLKRNILGEDVPNVPAAARWHPNANITNLQVQQGRAKIAERNFRNKKGQTGLEHRRTSKNKTTPRRRQNSFKVDEEHDLTISRTPSKWAKRREHELTTIGTRTFDPTTLNPKELEKKTRNTFNKKDERDCRTWSGNGGRLGKLNAMYFRLDQLNEVSDGATLTPELGTIREQANIEAMLYPDENKPKSKSAIKKTLDSKSKRRSLRTRKVAINYRGSSTSSSRESSPHPAQKRTAAENDLAGRPNKSRKRVFDAVREASGRGDAKRARGARTTSHSAPQQQATTKNGNTSSYTSADMSATQSNETYTEYNFTQATDYGVLHGVAGGFTKYKGHDWHYTGHSPMYTHSYEDLHHIAAPYYDKKEMSGMHIVPHQVAAGAHHGYHLHHGGPHHHSGSFDLHSNVEPMHDDLRRVESEPTINGLGLIAHNPHQLYRHYSDGSATDCSSPVCQSSGCCSSGCQSSGYASVTPASSHTNTHSFDTTPALAAAHFYHGKPHHPMVQPASAAFLTSVGLPHAFDAKPAHLPGLTHAAPLDAPVMAAHARIAALSGSAEHIDAEGSIDGDREHGHDHGGDATPTTSTFTAANARPHTHATTGLGLNIRAAHFAHYARTHMDEELERNERDGHGEHEHAIESGDDTELEMDLESEEDDADSTGNFGE